MVQRYSGEAELQYAVEGQFAVSENFEMLQTVLIVCPCEQQ